MVSIAVLVSLEVAERRHLDCVLDRADCLLDPSPRLWLAYWGYLGILVACWSPFVRGALLDVLVVAPRQMLQQRFMRHRSPDL